MMVRLRSFCGSFSLITLSRFSKVVTDICKPFSRRQARREHRSRANQKKPQWFKPGLINAAQTICKPTRSEMVTRCIGPTDWRTVPTRKDSAGQKEAPATLEGAHGAEGLWAGLVEHPPALRLRPLSWVEQARGGANIAADFNSRFDATISLCNSSAWFCSGGF